jgi:hypothetical protein
LRKPAAGTADRNREKEKPMAQLWCTGPAHIYVGVTTSRAPLYLGTAETKPDIDIRGEFEGVMNDLSGSKIPMDELWEGEEGMISFVLTRWNMNVALLMMAQPNFTGTPGLNSQDDMGTLMLTEGLSYPVWIRFPYATSKVAMAGMVAGYRFWSCILLAPKKIEPGTRAMKKHFALKAKRAFTSDAAPNNLPLKGGSSAVWRLYDHDMSGLPTIN